ncbi:MAG: hypothetical protein UV78_C0050G0012 [Parcubacteria group bacterium GW2011_GWA2_43_17]|nr:MAG: hypothetical protein UV78_C0050G0012 [Parcubacteria group bacterium GW2011_GWA2_43_17]KKT90722.1 MAG: hypothetical protein UW91_C0049G0002 [Parcubacteria group bacterium GW2011_GWF2_45_11]
MSYYTVLGLNKEPFSASPDPDFFYDSSEHHAALVRLLVEIRLRRGLSVILGDVGTGKTTLSRKLFQMLKARPDMLFFMIMDPTVNSEELFLESLVRVFNIPPESLGAKTILDYKEAIKKFLYQKGVEENKTVVLVVDEAQKLNPMAIEALRVLLNYETNEFKLLQLVLFSQMELLPRINEIKNFVDRIVLKYALNPLDEKETRDMIEFRLRQAGYNSELRLFTDEAVSEIHKFSQGYPRRINLICHNALCALISEDKVAADGRLIRDLIARSII